MTFMTSCLLKMEPLKVFLIVGTITGCFWVVDAQGYGRRRWEPPPKREDYEAKVMIFHNHEPRLNLLEPKEPDADEVVRHSSVNDVVGHIVKGLLRHRMTPREREAYDAKVNAQRLEEYHKMNARMQKEKAEEEENRRLHKEQMRQEAILRMKQDKLRSRGFKSMNQQHQNGGGVLAPGRRGFINQQERNWDRTRTSQEFQGSSNNNIQQFADSSRTSYGAMNSNKNYWNRQQPGQEGPSVKVSIPYDNQEQLRVPIRKGAGGSQSLSSFGNQRNSPQGNQISPVGMQRNDFRNSITEVQRRVPPSPHQELPRVPLTRGRPSPQNFAGPIQQQRQQMEMQQQKSMQQSSYSEDARRRNNQPQRPPPQQMVSISEDSVQKIIRKSSSPKGENPKMKPEPVREPPKRQRNQQQQTAFNSNQIQKKTSVRNNNNNKIPPQASLAIQRIPGNTGQNDGRLRQQGSNSKSQKVPQSLNEDKGGRVEIERDTQEDLRVSLSEKDVIVGPQALVQPQVSHVVAPDIPSVKIPYRNNNNNNIGQPNRWAPTNWDNKRQNMRRGPQEQPPFIM